MKKLLTMLSLTAALSLGATSASAVSNLPINENFNSGSSNVSWTNSSFLSFVDDGNGGKAMKLDSGESGKYVECALTEAVTSGTFKISCSIKPGADLSTMIRLVGTDRNQGYVPVFFSPEGKMSLGRGNATESAAAMNAIYRTDCAIDTWYDVECIIDLDEQTSRIKVTDSLGKVTETRLLKLNEYETDTRLDDIKNFRFQIWSEPNRSSVIDNIKIEEEPITFKTTTDNMGNVFGTNDAINIKINLKNTSSDKYSVTPKWTVYDYDGNIVESGQEITLLNKEEKIITVTPNVDKNGIYKFKCDLEADKATGKSNPVSKTETVEFSKILSCEPTEKNNFFGFSGNLVKEGSVQESVELMNKIGSAGWRDWDSWVATEPKTQGTYKFDASWQTLMDSSKTKVTENVLVLGFGNPVWQELVPEEKRDALRVPTNADEIAAFVEYSRYIVQNTKDAVGCYEVWNEYDGGFNVGTTNPSDSNYDSRANTDNYITLLKAVYEMIKVEAPDAEVVGLGGAGLKFSLGKTFVREFFEKGGYNYCDALSLHPYDRTTYFPNQTWLDESITLKKYMSDYNVDMPIYFTEMGRSTGIETTPTQQANHPVVIEKEQAIEIAKVNAFARAKDCADRIYWYDFQEDGDDLADEESCFGIVSWTRNQKKGALFPKPAFVAAAAMNKLMSGEVTPTDLYIEESQASTSTATDHHNGKTNFVLGAYCFDRVDKGDRIVAMWNDLTKGTTILNLGCETIDLYDLYGNKADTISSPSGIYRIDATGTVVYLVGDIKKLEYAESAISEIAQDVAITTDKANRSVTISGSVLNPYVNEIATVIAVPKGKELTGENILYINEMELTDGEFNHTLSVPKCDDGSLDIYIGATNAYKVKTNGTDNAWTKVVTVSLDNSATDKITASATVTNHTDSDEKLYMILAQYSSDRELVSVEIEEVTVSGNTDSAIKTITADKTVGATSYSCFVWDKLDNMKPLYEQVSI